MSIRQFFCIGIAGFFLSGSAIAQQASVADMPAGSEDGAAISAPAPKPATMSGTVTDINGGIVPGAHLILEEAAAGEKRTATSSDNGGFSFNDLKPGVPYHVAIRADGFVNWTSPAIVLNPGQYFFLTDSKLAPSGDATSVTVFASSEQIAAEQVKVEEQQRVLGFVPNFYVVYDHDAAPLTTKLKFKLALRAEADPITFVGVAFVAGLDQGGSTPNYGGGAAGYGQRVGALYANGFSDIMIGGAILPSLLHQDPRYFYQGTGTTRSRFLHAISSPFVAKGDNGHWEPNFSSVGGDLASGAISNAYYPESNRGPSLVFENAAIVTGGRMANGLVQEFILRRFTPNARSRAY
jgi:hypothetical protein